MEARNTPSARPTSTGRRSNRFSNPPPTIGADSSTANADGPHSYDARLFQKALDGLQVSPGQAIFIGNDGYRDIFGARQLGIKTILFRHTQDMTRPNDAEPDYIIRQFAELTGALEFFAAL